MDETSRKVSQEVASKLTAKETYIYFCLLCKCNWITLKTAIKQSTLAEFSGIPQRTISRAIQKFYAKELIDIKDTPIIGTKGTFTRYNYQLFAIYWVLIKVKLTDEPIGQELKGFLVLLKLSCINYTNRCLYTTAEELADCMPKVKLPDVERLLKEAEQAGYIKYKNKKDVQFIELIRKDLFLTGKESQGQKIYRIYPHPFNEEECADLLKAREAPDYKDKPYPNNKSRTPN